MQGNAGNDIFDGQGGQNWITTGSGQDTLILNGAPADICRSTISATVTTRSTCAAPVSRRRMPRRTSP
ncbi:hypothetical protein [Bradyrhizobium sp. 5.13L]